MNNRKGTRQGPRSTITDESRPSDDNSHYTPIQIELLFEDSTLLHERGYTRSGPFYEGDPARYGCWNCMNAFVAWHTAVSFGNAKGKPLALGICRKCSRKRSRLPRHEQLLFDHACSERMVRQFGREMGVKA